MRLFTEDVPSFAFKCSFQANMVFLLSMFVMVLALGWALRDHKRRLLELATDQQEDRLYLTILGILFVVTSLGSFFTFNKPGELDEEAVSRNMLINEVAQAFKAFTGKLEMPKTPVPYVPESPIKLPLPHSQHVEHDWLAQNEDAFRNDYLILVAALFTLVFSWAAYYFYPRHYSKITAHRTTTYKSNTRREPSPTLWSKPHEMLSHSLGSDSSTDGEGVTIQDSGSSSETLKWNEPTMRPSRRESRMSASRARSGLRLTVRRTGSQRNPYSAQR